MNELAPFETDNWVKAFTNFENNGIIGGPGLEEVVNLIEWRVGETDTELFLRELVKYGVREIDTFAVRGTPAPFALLLRAMAREGGRNESGTLLRLAQVYL